MISNSKYHYFKLFIPVFIPTAIVIILNSTITKNYKNCNIFFLYYFFQTQTDFDLEKHGVHPIIWLQLNVTFVPPNVIFRWMSVILFSAKLSKLIINQSIIQQFKRLRAIIDYAIETRINLDWRR